MKDMQFSPTTKAGGEIAKNKRLLALNNQLVNRKEIPNDKTPDDVVIYLGKKVEEQKKLLGESQVFMNTFLGEYTKLEKDNKALLEENKALQRKVEQPTDQGPDDDIFTSMRKKLKSPLDDPAPSSPPPDEATKLKRENEAPLTKVYNLKARNDSLEKDHLVKLGAKPVFFGDKGGSGMFPPTGS